MEMYLKCFIVTTVMVVVVSTDTHETSARPDYMKGFIETYEKFPAGKKCLLCHGKNKKNRNNYGQAFEKVLGGKNVKNGAFIKNALKGIEPEPSAIPDKSFGDLIEAGEPPGELIE